MNGKLITPNGVDGQTNVLRTYRKAGIVSDIKKDQTSPTTTAGAAKPTQNKSRSRHLCVLVVSEWHRGMKRMMTEKIAKNGAIVNFIPTASSIKRPASSIRHPDLLLETIMK